MSPSGGAMTTVEPSITWSPENSSRSSSSRKQRWFDAWPGVCTARQAELGGLDHVAVAQLAVDREAVARVVGEHLGAGRAWPAGRRAGGGRGGCGCTRSSGCGRRRSRRWRRGGRRRRGRGRRRRPRRCRRGRCSCRGRSSRRGSAPRMRRTSGDSAEATPVTSGLGGGRGLVGLGRSGRGSARRMPRHEAGAPRGVGM